MDKSEWTWLNLGLARFFWFLLCQRSCVMTLLLSSTCGCCRVEVAAVVSVWRHTLPYWLHHRDWVWTPCLAEAPASFCFYCLNLSHSPRCERWLRGFSANDEMSMCEPPSPTSPSPPPTLHHMMAWVGLPLWVTQLWGAVLARPLSPVSEPRLMTADDDPVVFLPSYTCLFLLLVTASSTDSSFFSFIYF